MRILVTDGMDKTAMAELKAQGHEVVEQFYEPAELGKALRDFDVVVVRSKTKVRAAQIDEAKGSQLKLIIRGGVGVDNIDVDYAKAAGIDDIFHIPGIEEQLGIPYVEMDELLAKADFISVHAPAVDGGALINAERIAKMKDGVVIINTSRGTNVDEAALLAGLESGKVRAAGLDVYADEPATNKALYSHPMVSCTPHIGAATVEAQKRIGAEIVDIISKM